VSGELLFWGHLVAAAAYALVALAQLRGRDRGLPAVLFRVALAVTAIWSMSVAIPETLPPVTPSLAEACRDLAWLAFVAAVIECTPGSAVRSTRVLWIAVASIIGLRALAELTLGGHVSLALSLLAAIAFLVLIHNLYGLAAPSSRWGLRLIAIALAAMLAYALNLYTIAWLDGRPSYDLVAARGVVMLLILPLFVLASRRNRSWKVRLSHAAAFQTLSLGLIGGYLVAMTIMARAVAMIGGEAARFAQIALVVTMAVGATLLVSSDRVRGTVRVNLLKHFFQHRYDYRSEWLRLIGTLGRSGPEVAPLPERVIEALADIVDSPSGVLLTRGGDGPLAAIARWNWPGPLPIFEPVGPLIDYLEANGRILDFPGLRRGRESRPGEIAAVPQAMIADPRGWLAIPLLLETRLIGIVIIAPSRAPRALDWEDFDLLRIAGRQAASHLAERQLADALSEAQRFEEFNRRFAFILHDIKNLVSQLSLLARNAERHAEKPEFRLDMIATLNNSTAKMRDLLARLAQHHSGSAGAMVATDLYPLVERIAAGRRDRHPISIEGETLAALTDPAGLEQAIGHLLDNAIDASPPAEPIRVRVAAVDGQAQITIADSGEGMDDAFIRDRLFTPFSSTKSAGFGIGAYEARAIVNAMQGRLEVVSRRGEGTVFTLSLPLVAHGAAVERKRA
jgi:putative PEP-CTERM system histidine kinase